ncbi:hypothetical protein MCEMIE22_02107 [Mycobacteriaceae bacterium]|jgi:hypothetical protein
MTEVFIYCDASAHKGRRVKVAKFYRVPHGQDRRPGWSEHPEVPLLTLGTQLVGDELRTPAELIDSCGKGSRWRPRFGCTRCGDEVALANDALLFAALDDRAEEGVSKLSLSDLRATVKRISTQVDPSRDG